MTEKISSKQLAALLVFIFCNGTYDAESNIFKLYNDAVDVLTLDSKCIATPRFVIDLTKGPVVEVTLQEGFTSFNKLQGIVGNYIHSFIEVPSGFEADDFVDFIKNNTTPIHVGSINLWGVGWFKGTLIASISDTLYCVTSPEGSVYYLNGKCYYWKSYIPHKMVADILPLRYRLPVAAYSTYVSCLGTMNRERNYVCYNEMPCYLSEQGKIVGTDDAILQSIVRNLDRLQIYYDKETWDGLVAWGEPAIADSCSLDCPKGHYKGLCANGAIYAQRIDHSITIVNTCDTSIGLIIGYNDGITRYILANDKLPKLLSKELVITCNGLKEDKPSLEEDSVADVLFSACQGFVTASTQYTCETIAGIISHYVDDVEDFKKYVRDNYVKKG